MCTGSLPSYSAIFGDSYNLAFKKDNFFEVICQDNKTYVTQLYYQTKEGSTSIGTSTRLLTTTISINYLAAIGLYCNDGYQSPLGGVVNASAVTITGLSACAVGFPVVSRAYDATNDAFSTLSAICPDGTSSGLSRPETIGGFTCPSYQVLVGFIGAISPQAGWITSVRVVCRIPPPTGMDLSLIFPFSRLLEQGSSSWHVSLLPTCCSSQLLPDLHRTPITPCTGQL